MISCNTMLLNIDNFSVIHDKGEAFEISEALRKNHIDTVGVKKAGN